jgi:predicted lipase
MTTDPDTETKLKRTCAISIFSYIYGEPYNLFRLGKSNLLQFTRYVVSLDFKTSIGQQMRKILTAAENNQIQFPMDDYNTSLFKFIANDEYFDDLYLEYNIQNKLGGECYIFRHRSTNEIIVSFRGSDTPLDLWIDITVETVPLVLDDIAISPDIRVHCGFIRQLTNYDFHIQLTKIVETFISKSEQPINIQIVGHSLGSALGSLFAFYLHRNLISDKMNIEVYTNGAPPVGNSAWMREFNNVFVNNGRRNHFRLINENDIVPNLHTFFYKVIDTIPFIRQYAENTSPPLDIKRIISRFLNQSVLDYKHTGIDTYIIVDSILKRVDNATHTFAEPTIYDLLNVANTHMIDYQRWISV